MLRTWLTERYGLETPFVSAGMGFIALPPLVSAVSNAGALGLLAGGVGGPQVLRQMIGETRRLTDRPFGVNLIIESTIFGPLTTGEKIEVCIEERVPAVVFFWTAPPEEWVRSLKQSGCDVWLQTSSIENAQAAVASGVDVIIAQGSEAGGHNRGTTSLLTLVPRMVDALDPLPVVAAGGIADGRGMAAALCLGAAGVCVGTRMIATLEANAHPDYKRRIVDAKAEDIARTCIFGPEWPDAPMRVIRNRVVRDWEGRDSKTPPQPQPAQTIGTTVLGGREYAMPKFSAMLPIPETSGDFEEMCLAAGESVAFANSITAARDIVRGMTEDAERVLAQNGSSARSTSAN